MGRAATHVGRAATHVAGAAQMGVIVDEHTIQTSRKRSASGGQLNVNKRRARYERDAGRDVPKKSGG